MADVVLWIGRRRIPNDGGMVSSGIAQAIFDMAAAGPGAVSEIPAMKAAKWPGNRKSIVRQRLKRKIEYSCENRDQDYAKGQYPESPITESRPSFRPGRRASYNYTIPSIFALPCHGLGLHDTGASLSIQGHHCCPDSLTGPTVTPTLIEIRSRHRQNHNQSMDSPIRRNMISFFAEVKSPVRLQRSREVQFQLSCLRIIIKSACTIQNGMLTKIRFPGNGLTRGEMPLYPVRKLLSVFVEFMQ